MIDEIKKNGMKIKMWNRRRVDSYKKVPSQKAQTKVEVLYSNRFKSKWAILYIFG